MAWKRKAAAAQDRAASKTSCNPNDSEQASDAQQRCLPASESCIYLAAYAPFVVLIGKREVWGRYERLEHALQATYALRRAGFTPRVESGAFRALRRRLRAIEDELQ